MATKDFAQIVKEQGSVSKAFESMGYKKGSDGSWRPGTSSNGTGSSPKVGSGSSSNKGSSGSSSKTTSSASGATATTAPVSTTQNRNLNAQGYDPNVDYSLAIRNSTDANEIKQLQAERQNKINSMYGGVDPYTSPTVNQSTGKTTTPTNTASKVYGSNWTPQTATAESNKTYQAQQAAGQSAFSNYLAQQVASGAMSQRDADLAWAQAGGTVNYANGTPAWHLGAQGYNESADLSDAALNSVAKSGDWDGVDEILRQRKLQAQAAGLSYDAIPDWYALNQMYGGPSAGMSLGQMYSGAKNAYGVSGSSGPVSNVQSVKDPTLENVDKTAGVNPGLGSGGMGDYLNQWYQNAQQQQQNTIDFGTNQAILELLRNKQDAEAQYQEQRNQIAIDEAKAKDNQALYAESRGDKGGIGAAQYDAIMNTAAQNRLQVNSAQTKLATDTSRQIADLRAQGEYEKADALLTLSQQYLSQLMSLEQWAAEYNLSVAQFNASLQQWQAEYDLKVADLLGSYNGQQTLSAKQFAFNQQQYADEQQAAQEKKLASAGEILLAAGIMPSASQLAAMGMTTTEAQSYITAQKVAAAAKTKSSSSGGGGNTVTEEKPRISASAAESALTEKENYTTSTLSAYDYYYGDGSAINVLMENNEAVGKLVRNLSSIEGEGNVNARRYASIKQYYEKGYFNSAVYAYLLAYFGVDSTEG